LGGVTRTNPDPRDLIAEVRSQHPALVGDPGSLTERTSPRGPLGRLRDRAGRTGERC
jgi:hypothetical protein